MIRSLADYYMKQLGYSREQLVSLGALPDTACYLVTHKDYDDALRMVLKIRNDYICDEMIYHDYLKCLERAIETKFRVIKIMPFINPARIEDEHSDLLVEMINPQSEDVGIVRHIVQTFMHGIIGLDPSKEHFSWFSKQELLDKIIQTVHLYLWLRAIHQGRFSSDNPYL